MKSDFKISKDEKELLAIKYKYVNEALFFYTTDYNDEFFFGVEEFDFRLDGYQIRLNEDITDMEIITNYSSEINKMEGLVNEIIDFKIDLTNFKTIFTDLMKMDIVISIEREYYDEDYFFLIGKIVDVLDDSLVFKDFDINGEFSDDLNYVPYELITTIRFNSNYTNTWQKYLKNNV